MNERKKYERMYAALHKHPHRFVGVSTEKHIPDIKRLIEETNSKTLLDFGCGKGMQYSEDKIYKKWGNIKPELYDPGVEAFKVLPNKIYDGVLCIDVLEHVPESAIIDVLNDIISRSNKFVFLNVSTRLAGINLPNGKNVHCTVKEHNWWEEQVLKVKHQLNSNVIILLESRKSNKEIIQTTL